MLIINVYYKNHTHHLPVGTKDGDMSKGGRHYNAKGNRACFVLQTLPYSALERQVVTTSITVKIMILKLDLAPTFRTVVQLTHEHTSVIHYSAVKKCKGENGTLH